MLNKYVIFVLVFFSILLADEYNLSGYGWEISERNSENEIWNSRQGNATLEIIKKPDSGWSEITFLVPFNIKNNFALCIQSKATYCLKQIFEMNIIYSVSRVSHEIYILTNNKIKLEEIKSKIYDSDICKTADERIMSSGDIEDNYYIGDIIISGYKVSFNVSEYSTEISIKPEIVKRTKAKNKHK